MDNILDLTFAEYIVEAGKTPHDITWNKSEHLWDGYFEINDVRFNIQFSDDNHYCEFINVWTVNFDRDGLTKMLNDYKYPFSVVPTIQKAMEDFLVECQPPVLGFVGNKDDKSRVKIYEKNSKVYSDKYDYRLYINKSTDYFAFVLYRDPQFKTCVERLKNEK